MTATKRTFLPRREMKKIGVFDFLTNASYLNVEHFYLNIISSPHHSCKPRHSFMFFYHQNIKQAFQSVSNAQRERRREIQRENRHTHTGRDSKKSYKQWLHGIISSNLSCLERVKA